MKAAKTWNPSKVPGLYRHVSGTYYARICIAGKQSWRTLKTKVFEIAKVEHEKVRQEVDFKNELAKEITLEQHLTGAQAIAIRERQITNSTNLKKATQLYWNALITSLKKSWPELMTAELRHIKVEDCQAWAAIAVKKMSPTRYNNSLSLVRSIFDIAIERGARKNNPASKVSRTKVKLKDLSSRLPKLATFTEWVTTIRHAGSRFSAHCGDFVEFLAYTGVRKGEAAWIRWQDCDFERGEILIVGDPEEGTKNSEARRVPMIPAAISLLTQMKSQRTSLAPEQFVLQVREAQKSMNHAADKVGMTRITHHDLRHLFATICIESGVDIPTVSKWLGHKDGGALAMRVYGHLRNEHSLAAASRVSFAA